MNPLAIQIPEQIAEVTRGMSRKQLVEFIARLCFRRLVSLHELSRLALETRQSSEFDRYAALRDEEEMVRKEGMALLQRAQSPAHGEVPAQLYRQARHLLRQADNLYDRANAAWKKADAMWSHYTQGQDA